MAKGKKRPDELPEYGTVMMKGVQYYRTRITDADGKRVAIYGLTREELYDRVEEAQKKIAEVVFHRENPTVEEYCEKWLLMRSGTVRTNTLEGYERMVIGIRADGESVKTECMVSSIWVGQGDQRGQMRNG